MTDLLSLTSSTISVGIAARQPYVYVPYSRLILHCLSKLYALGYITAFRVVNEWKICVYLKYVNGKPVIRRIVRVSTPGNRLYYRINRFRKGDNFQGFYLVSTSQGILTDQECLLYKVGGEPLYIVL